MNFDQVEYDKKVQARNRQTAINKLNRKLKSIKTARRIAYIKGKADKIRNHRRMTLAQYKDEITKTDTLIDELEEKIIRLSQHNDKPKPVKKSIRRTIRDRIKNPQKRKKNNYSIKSIKHEMAKLEKQLNKLIRQNEMAEIRADVEADINEYLNS